nr:hypothetical protein [Heyndrickxia oleronia]
MNKNQERKKVSKQRDQERKRKRQAKEINGFPISALITEEEADKLRKAIRK